MTTNKNKNELSNRTNFLPEAKDVYGPFRKPKDAVEDISIEELVDNKSRHVDSTSRHVDKKFDIEMLVEAMIKEGNVKNKTTPKIRLSTKIADELENFVYEIRQAGIKDMSIASAQFIVMSWFRYGYKHHKNDMLSAIKQMYAKENTEEEL